jgi:NAD(P)H-dependent FMN reductase
MKVIGATRDSIVVAVIDGSPRSESHTRILVQAVGNSLMQHGAAVRLYSQREHRLPLFEDEPGSEQHPSVQELFSIVQAADCVVLSSPEYHNSISGALKNALDWLSLMPPNTTKPMLLCGLIGGGGAMGNSGALVQMMMAVRSMKWWLMPDVMVSVPNIWDAFDGSELRDCELVKRVDEFSASLVRYGKAFRQGSSSEGLLSSTISAA